MIARLTATSFNDTATEACDLSTIRKKQIYHDVEVLLGKDHISDEMVREMLHLAERLASSSAADRFDRTMVTLLISPELQDECLECLRHGREPPQPVTTVLPTASPARGALGGTN